jgi:hypothetical protein
MTRVLLHVGDNDSFLMAGQRCLCCKQMLRCQYCSEDTNVHSVPERVCKFAFHKINLRTCFNEIESRILNLKLRLKQIPPVTCARARARVCVYVCVCVSEITTTRA